MERMTAICVDGIGAGAAPSGIFSQLQVARPRRGRCRSRRPTWHRGADPYAVRSYDAVVPAYGAAFDKTAGRPSPRGSPAAVSSPADITPDPVTFARWSPPGGTANDATCRLWWSATSLRRTRRWYPSGTPPLTPRPAGREIGPCAETTHDPKTSPREARTRGCALSATSALGGRPSPRPIAADWVR